jgi:multidrug efflux system membrane fusion protein
MPGSVRSSPSKSRKAMIAGVLVVALLGGLWFERAHLLSAPGGPDAGGQTANAGTTQKDEGVPVTLAVASAGDFSLNLDELGTVQALNTVTVHTQITGRIVKIGFTQGDMVNKGDLLAEIDPQPYQAALDQAKGQLARDQASLQGALVDLARYKTLSTQNVVSQQTYDTQVALVAQDRGAIESDQAAVEAANVNLLYCRIVSPLRGRAGFRLVDEGNLVQPADATGIVAIEQVQPISVVFPAPQDDIPAIDKALAPGTAPVLAMAEDGQTVLSHGVLSYTDNQVNVATGTISLKATFPNEDNALWPGQSVTVRLLLDTLKNVTLMPEAAVQHGPDGLFAYIAGANGKAQMRPIKVSQTDSGQVVVSDGIKPGDKVVTDGAYSVQPGVLLKVTEPKADQGQAPPTPANGQQPATSSPVNDTPTTAAQK